MHHHHLHRLPYALTILLAMLVGAAPATRTSADQVSRTPASSCGWTIVKSPDPAPGDLLWGVASVSASDIWAVGNTYDWHTGRYQTLIEHWDGTSWSVVKSPNPSLLVNELNGVVAVSANDVWAVGQYNRTYMSNPETLIEHWNGVRWSIFPSPNGSSSGSILAAVTAVSTRNVWAVGAAFNPQLGWQTLTEHWDGNIWRAVPSPNPSGPALNFLYGVTAIGVRDIWAVGQAPYMALIEHLGGDTSWRIVPSLGDAILRGVAAVSASDIWAVGGPDTAFIEHWDGTNWSVVPGPAIAGLNGVAAVSPNDVWAVGGYSLGTQTEHWNGSDWSTVPSPSPGTLYGVTAISAHDVWAVGFSGNGEVSDQTVIERYC